MLTNSTATDVQVSLPAPQIIRSRALEWVPELWVTLHLGLGEGKKRTKTKAWPVLFFALGQKIWNTGKHT